MEIIFGKAWHKSNHVQGSYYECIHQVWGQSDGRFVRKEEEIAWQVIEFKVDPIMNEWLFK